MGKKRSLVVMFARTGALSLALGAATLAALAYWNSHPTLATPAEPPVPPEVAARLAEVVDVAADRMLALELRGFRAWFAAGYERQLAAESAAIEQGIGDRAAMAVLPEIRPIVRRAVEKSIADVARPGDGHASLSRKLAARGDWNEGALVLELGAARAEYWAAVVRGLEKAGLPVPAKYRPRG